MTKGHFSPRGLALMILAGALAAACGSSAPPLPPVYPDPGTAEPAAPTPPAERMAPPGEFSDSGTPGSASSDAARGISPAGPSGSAPAVLWAAHGSRLESLTLNFRVEAPAGWAWSEDAAHSKPGTTHFIARRDATTFFRLTVREPGPGESKSPPIEAFLATQRAAYERSGFTVTELQHAAQRVPAGDGYRFSHRLAHAGKGGVVLADGFVVWAGGRAYMLQYTSQNRSELPAFGRFVESLTLLQPAAGSSPSVGPIG